ncbi:MAG: M20/M25/M40 family metallo-hydrolase [Planctomycetota bacterium]|nr:MAG: M20/M25/M40 family metallo-hydrolase [Planctomycetota bacterium]
MVKMPGQSYSGPLPPLSDEQLELRAELRRHIHALAADIADKNILNHHNLAAAAAYIESALADAGFQARRQDYSAEGKTCSNIEAQITGELFPDQIVVIGAHYDSVFGSPGANDNCSAVAANLALARRLKNTKPARTLRFVFFANEEMPFFQTEQMGSRVYAKSCREKNENIFAMLSLETIGYYTDAPNTQKYPFPFSIFYPSTGNFLGFVSNTRSKDLLHSAISSFRKHCKFPSQGGAIPEFVPGIDWSDQESFWHYNYPAIMLTDTAPYRYPYYHSPDDTIDKICFDHLARVVSGLTHVIGDLVTPPDL